MTEIPQGALGVDKPQCLFSGKQVRWLQPLFPSSTDTFVSILALQASRITFLKNSSDYMTPPKTLPMGSDLPGGLISHSFPLTPIMHHCQAHSRSMPFSMLFHCLECLSHFPQW